VNGQECVAYIIRYGPVAPCLVNFSSRLTNPSSSAPNGRRVAHRSIFLQPVKPRWPFMLELGLGLELGFAMILMFDRLQK